MTSQEPAPGYDPLLFVLGIQAHHSLSLFTYDSLSPQFVFWLMFIIHLGDLTCRLPIGPRLPSAWNYGAVEKALRESTVTSS
jgi:hypothetical protein